MSIELCPFFIYIGLCFIHNLIPIMLINLLQIELETMLVLNYYTFGIQCQLATGFISIHQPTCIKTWI